MRQFQNWRLYSKNYFKVEKMCNKMNLKKLRVVLQRLSEKEIEDYWKSYGGSTGIKDLRDTDQQGNLSLPKKMNVKTRRPFQFQCKLCGKFCSRSYDLKTHMRTHTGEKYKTCDICLERFSWSYQLKNHENTVHFGQERQKDYKCSMCERSYLNKSSIYNHMARKHGENRNPNDLGISKSNCKFCDKSFPSLLKLTEHVRTHTGEKPFGCSLCPFRSSQNSTLQTHIKRIHTKDKPYKCLICFKGFTLKNGLVSHSRVHTGEKPYTCSQCQKRFTYKSGLNIHMRTHTGEKPYNCTFCNKNFRQRNALRYHTSTHTKETIKKFECSECASKFNNTGQLRIHMRIHTGEKPFTCKLCTKTFRFLSNFRNHEKSHTESFDCDECEKKYSRKSHLADHKQRVHIRDKIFECTFCGKEFYDKNNLTKHIVTHTKERAFKCSHCDSTFGRPSDMSRHMLKCKNNTK